MEPQKILFKDPDEFHQEPLRVGTLEAYLVRGMGPGVISIVLSEDHTSIEDGNEVLEKVAQEILQLLKMHSRFTIEPVY